MSIDYDTHFKSPLAEATKTEMKPPFIDAKLDGPYTVGGLHTPSGYHLRVPGCNCRVSNPNGTTYEKEKCTITPCAATAFKNLQIQQLAHANSIASLKSSVNKLAASITPIPKPAPAIPSPKPSDTSIRKEVSRMLRQLRESQAEL
jgi:hypothetical protein